MRQFVLLSLTTHLALLVVWHEPVLMPFAAPLDNVLSVELPDTSQMPVSSPTAAALITSQTRSFSQEEHEIHDARRFRSDETGGATTPPPDQPATVNSNTAMASSEAALVRIRSRLLGDLARHFYYPLLARQHGWEGTVLVGLRVESDGHLEQIRIERSSGYAVLDHSALNSLNRLGQIAGVSAWLNGRGMDMQLPVIYQLVEN
jgi:protein TonB